jgi:hypothetical protein
MAENAARHFIPWVRQGTAVGISTPDTLTSNQPAKVSFPVKLKFAQFDTTSTVQLYGPADITAIDPQQIVRMEPRPFTTNFAYNLFPCIEFDRPDFPWLFTPAKPGLNERLRPWICLVVVKKQEGVQLSRDDAAALPVLEIGTPARPGLELPDLEESWAWTHAQVTGAVGDNPATIKGAISQAPERTVSRLVCPRRLEARTAYIACLVPAFEVGCKSALGQSVTDADLSTLAPAWQATLSEVRLPVYYSWEFSTGENADFESLVRLLQPRIIGEPVGTLPFCIGDPGFGLPRDPDGVTALRGVLQPVDLAESVPAAIPGALREALAKILNAPADALERPVSDPVVAPPIYGSSYPPKNRVELTPAAPPWINELNLEPRHRVAASLGTQIIQQDQEALMASAWEQIEQLRQNNLQRRRDQLALVARTATFIKQVSRLDNDAMLQLVGPSMTKIPATESTLRGTAAAEIWSSEFPAFCSPVLRRVARPRGPVNRRILTRDFLATQNRRLVKLVDVLPSAPKRPQPSPDRVGRSVPGMVTIQRISTAAQLPSVDARKLTPASVQSETSHGFFVWNVNHWERANVAFVQQLKQAAFEHLDRVIRFKPVLRPSIIKPNASTLLNRLNPQAPRFVNLAVAAVAGADEDMLLAHPQFPRPMSERLIELAPHLLLPGLDSVPPNTVALVRSNPRFIEAFMVGLNHEMGRELLWREYPTDQRGTYFRFFWDEEGAPAGNASMALPPMHQWSQSLGENFSGAAGPKDPLILLVRGELLRRYPNAILYAAKAQRDAAGRVKPGAMERYPLFRGSAPPDVTFFGFQLAEDEARGSTEPAGDAGWFFVIQQQPGEPEFGLDVGPDGDPAPVTQWSQLTWRHLVRSDAELDALTHVTVNQGDPPRPDTSANPPGATWGVNAAHMARITMQQPVRIAIHARQMLPPEKEGGAHG